VTDFCEWTNLFPRNTGLPVTIWISVDGVVCTDPYNPEKVERAEAVTEWISLNREALLAHWRGDIDGGASEAVENQIV
jgi:hypothetical protein